MGGWANSDRRSRLPTDWPKRRARVMHRAGGRCEAIENGARCSEPAKECDHIRPGDDHSHNNLQALCPSHHQRKTIAERPASLRRRPAQPHPGLRS